MDDSPRAPLLSAWDLLPGMALAGAWLWLQHWLPVLPERIPSHWNAGGVVNGWMDKGAFLAFATWPALGLWALLFLIGAAIRLDEAPRGQLGAKALLPLRGLLPAAFMLMAGGFSPMAAFYGGKAIAWGAGLLVLCLIAGLVPVIRLARLAPPIEGARPSDYHLGGLIYWNAADPRLLVPKRLGIGATFNFARPSAWICMALVLAPVAAVLVALARR